MATFFTGTDVDGIILSANGDLWINAINTYVVHTNNTFNFADTSGNKLLVNGTIIAEDGDAINSDTGGSGHTIEVSKTGYVSGASDGIELSGSNMRIANYGTIVGFQDTGIQTVIPIGQAGNANITNYGTIHSDQYGVYLEGPGNRILNSGDISGGNIAIRINEAGGNFISNAGLIQSSSTGFELNADSGILTLWNSGTIIAPTAIDADASDEIIRNTGTIIGDIDLAGGNDRLVNSGDISGDVNLGTGTDVLLGGAGRIEGAIDGGAGDDLLISGIGDDAVMGGVGADEIRGGLGNDVLAGGDHDDRAFGGDGDDTLSGDRGNDELFGGSGDDTLDGNFSDDILRGGAGADIVMGGLGADQLYGGQDADIFIFGKDHSKLGSLSDVIHDFQVGIDLIDLSAVVAGELQFVANGPFAGGGTASVRALTPATGQSSVLIDFDGNGTVDMRILLDGNPALTESDFIL